jgi:hypothetical protein
MEVALFHDQRQQAKAAACVTGLSIPDDKFTLALNPPLQP